MCTVQITDSMLSNDDTNEAESGDERMTGGDCVGAMVGDRLGVS